MKYIFRGYVDSFDDHLCWLHMRDATEPLNPDEAWCVPIARFPRKPELGQSLTLTITSRAATFTFDQPRRWTQRELDAAKARAKKLSALFSMEQPQSVSAVDPVGDDAADPSTRDKSSSSSHD